MDFNEESEIEEENQDEDLFEEEEEEVIEKEEESPERDWWDSDLDYVRKSTLSFTGCKLLF